MLLKNATDGAGLRQTEAPLRLAWSGTLADAGGAGIGSVVAISVADRDEAIVAVLVEARQQGWIAAVVDADPGFSGPGNQPLSAEVLGYGAVIQHWNCGPVLSEQVDGVLGTIEAEELHTWRKASAGDFRLDTADGRVLQRRIAADDAASYFDPSQMLEFRTFGALMQSRRQIFGRPRSAGPWLADAEADQIFLPRSVPAEKFSAAMRDLGIRWHEGSRRLLGQTLALVGGSGFSSSAVAGTSVMARSPSRGSSSHREHVTEEIRDFLGHVEVHMS